MMVKKGPFDAKCRICVFLEIIFDLQNIQKGFTIIGNKIQNRCVMISKSIKFAVKNIGFDFQVSQYLISFASKGKPFSF